MPTKPPKKPGKLAPPVTEPLPGEAKAAEEFGSSLLTFRLAVAAGIVAPGPSCKYLGPIVSSLAEVGIAFRVSERTSAGWRAKGMPVNGDGTYALPAIRQWRLLQPEVPDWMLGGWSSPATGDLARAIFRVYGADVVDAVQRARKDFMAALVDVDRSDDDSVDKLFQATLARHFDGLRLSELEIEQVISENWDLA